MLLLQDNGSRLRIGTSTAWEDVAGGDGQSQFLSQTALNTSAAGYALIGNWCVSGVWDVSGACGATSLLVFPKQGWLLAIGNGL